MLSIAANPRALSSPHRRFASVFSVTYSMHRGSCSPQVNSPRIGARPSSSLARSLFGGKFCACVCADRNQSRGSNPGLAIASASICPPLPWTLILAFFSAFAPGSWDFWSRSPVILHCTSLYYPHLTLPPTHLVAGLSRDDLAASKICFLFLYIR